MKILQQTPTKLVIQQKRNLRQESLAAFLLFLCCGLPSLFVLFFLTEQIQSILSFPTSATLNCQRKGAEEVECVLTESKLVGEQIVRKIADDQDRLLLSRVIPANTKLANEERNYQVLLQLNSGAIVLPQPSSSKVVRETAQQINQFVKATHPTTLLIQQNFTWLDFAQEFASWMGAALLIGGFLFLHSLYSLLAFTIGLYQNPVSETYGFDREQGVFTVEYSSWLNLQRTQLPLSLIVDVDLDNEVEESRLFFVLASGKQLSTFYPINIENRVDTRDTLEDREIASRIRDFLNLETDSLSDST